MSLRNVLKKFRKIAISIVILVSVGLSLSIVDIISVHATNVGGIIDVDTTWTLSGSPYIVVSPVLVYEDVTLTIEPGVVVKFNSGTALQMRGEMIAQGTSEQPITFTSNASSRNPGDWDYIFFTDTSASAVYDLDGNYVSGSILQHVVIEYAGGSSVFYNAALRLDRAAPYISHMTVRFSAINGIFYFGGGQKDLRISHCTVSDNTDAGIRIYENSGFTELKDCLIENNNDGGVQLSQGFESVNRIINNIIIGNKAQNHSGITIDGSWRSNVVFSSNLITRNSHPSGLCPGHCSSVYVQANSAEVRDNLIVDNEGGGLQVLTWDGAGSGVQIMNNIISDNKNQGLGLSIYFHPLTMMNNTILRNTSINESGFSYLAGEPNANISFNLIHRNTNTTSFDSRTILIGTNPQFNHNNIFGNNGYALWNYNSQGTPDVDARHNWWGTIGTAQISALIYDWFDDSSLGVVNFSPYLTAHNLDAPISPPSGFTLTPTSVSFVLNWAANPESDLAGYKVYYGTTRGFPYTGTGADQGDSPIDVGNALELTLTGLEQGVRYYFAVTAYDVDSDGENDQTQGHESWFSISKSAGMGQTPTANFTASPTSGSAPLQVAFTNLSTGDFTACLWEFGDENTSFNCNNPIHTYENAGSYTVRLTVVGLPGESSLTRAGYINVIVEEVEAEFSANPTSGIAPLTVEFTNQSTGTYDACHWDFGDWSTSEACDPPSHTYMSPGVYTVSLTISGLGGTDTQTREEYIQVYEPVQAEFSAHPTIGNAPLEVFFYNYSSGEYTACQWSFGDGGTSTDCHDPSYTYLTPGVYTVALTVSGPGGTDTQTHADYIQVHELVQAEFSADPTSGIAPLVVDFINNSTGDFDSCYWYFGDWNSSDDCEDPNHTYTSSGVYTVSLTVSGPGGTDTQTHEEYIHVYEPVEAVFSGHPTSGNAPLEVYFYNYSSGDYAACQWSFGDGGTSTDCHDPSHTYLTPGLYTVALTASGPGGTDTQTHADYIHVHELVQAEFSADPTSGIAPLKVDFTNQSTGDFDSCHWDFGDWNTSDDCANPSHTYTSSGVYTVSLMVSGPGGTDTQMHEEYIHVYEPVQAEFSGDPTIGIAPLVVDFTNHSTGDFDSCHWDFGDSATSEDCDHPSHTYLTSGVYTVALTVSGPGGTDTQTHADYIHVHELVQAEFLASLTSGIAPLKVDFTNHSTGDFDSCHWDFGDWNTSDTCEDPSHTYTSSGFYTVSLTVSGLGGTDTLTREGYISVSDDVAPVIANFSASPTSGIAPLEVTLINESTGHYDTCQWDFGDWGSSYECEDPSHTYLAPGVYTVALTVSGPGGTDTQTHEDYIHVHQPDVPDISIFLPLIFHGSPTVLTPPAAPILNVINNDDGDGDYTVSWSTSAGAETYNLQEATNLNFADAATAYAGSNTSVYISGRDTGSYYYRVRAVNANGQSAWSNIETVTVTVPVMPDIPDAPNLDEINNDDGDGNYSVSWSASAGAETYSLQEATNIKFSDASIVYSGPNSSVDLSDRDVGTYHYRVRAESVIGHSDWSNIETVNVTVPVIPDTPEPGNWSGTTSQGRSITWSVSPDGTQISGLTFSVGWGGSCGVSSSTHFLYGTPIKDNKFNKSSGGGTISGTFTSTTSAEGTFNATLVVHFPSYCTATRSGTWMASPTE